MHVKQRQSFDEDVFEACVLHFFIVSFKGCYDEYLLWFVFIINLLKFNLLMSFFPSKTWLQISVCVWLECVCVCTSIE